MYEEADIRFWQHFNQLIEELEHPLYCENPFYRSLEGAFPEPIALIERTLGVIRDLRERVSNLGDKECEPVVWHLILSVLFYVDKFGRGIKVTAGELDGTETVDESRSQIERLKQLVEEKGHDYNSGNISILSYFIWAEKSIVHEIHKRAQRLLSLNKAADQSKFESGPSTAFDLCAYAIFLLAYLRTFPMEGRSLELDQNPISQDSLNNQLATLCYVRSEGRTLMLRSAKSDNSGHPIYNALGGKVESGESPRACAIREIHEESGLTAEEIKLRGIVTITGAPGPSLAGRDWYVLIYEVTRWSGTISIGGPEGTPIWVDDTLLAEMHSGLGDQYFLEHLNQPGWFEGAIRYAGSELAHADFQHYSY